MTALPRIPGFEIRRYAGPADHPAMAGLITACNLADGEDEVTTATDLDAGYKHLTNCDPATDTAFVEHDGRLVAYSRTTWWDTKEGQRKYIVFFHVHPDVRAEGVERALLAWSEARNAEIAARHDIDNEKVYEGWANQTDRPDLARLFEESGYTAITYGATMVRPTLDDVPDAVLPHGVECRPVQAGHLRPIWEADNEAFRDHWGYSEPTEEDWGRFLDFPHRDESLWKVAWAGERIVGQVRSFINHEENQAMGRRRGYAEFISTARERRKKGVATALICASLRELAARGMSEAALGVHTENPTGALRLYQSLGFEIRRLYTTYQKLVREETVASAG